jgi:enamine deaminase RidA (YjgF/YER057c/UK114 family)
MPKEEIRSDRLAEPNGHFAQAVVAASGAGRLLFISGMTARNAEGGITGLGDIAAQTRQVCENVQAAVEEAGGTMDDIYVTDMRHFDAIHAVRREFFTGTPPASTMVEISKFSRPGYEIEMNAIAVLP